LTGTLLALSLILLGADDQPAVVVAEGPSLTIDSCIAVDQETVRQVMELEISNARLLPTSVSVRCVDGAQEIRIGRSASPDLGDVRTIHIAPAADDDTPAERQARSRELALAIAEFVRWPGPAARPIENPPEPVPPSPSPSPVPALAIASTPAAEATEGRWQLGILCAFEHFSRGQGLMGADLFVASRLGRWFLAELRIGGRMGTDQSLPEEHLTTRAATIAAAAGVNLWSRSRVFGGGIVLRAQGYLVQFRAEATGAGRVETANLGAFALALEPRLMVSLTRHFSLQASAAAGLVPRGIVVRIQGIETQSMSGLALSANLAGVLTF
jgi:hypothetical protein